VAGTLESVLRQARDLGFLGSGPIEDHITHAGLFAAAHPGRPARVVDLGSGGGIPGLALAVEHWPDADIVLVDSGERRTAFLDEAVTALGLAPRVRVLRARAEVVGRDPAHRGHYDTVVSRSFGPPAVTAECGAPLLAIGGVLLVSEPPTQLEDRWPTSGLELVGLADRTPTGSKMRVLVQSEPCPDRYPRRTGVPGKRPLF
jgi:16S rRNA (guanine527-N7)-methyltransferase